MSAQPSKLVRGRSASPRTRLLVFALGAVLAGGPGTAAQNVSATGSMPTAAHATEVRYSEGMLTISANNASLNQVLHEIAQRTGMKLSGSVHDERVFGTYGPGEPSQVIGLLLDGTGSNVLLVEGANDQPRELILTRRLGGASPPDPNAAARVDADEDEDGAPPQANVPMRRGAPARNLLPSNAPGFQAGGAPPQPSTVPAQQAVGGPDQNPAAPNGSPSSTEQPVVFPPVDATTAPATASSTPADSTDSTPKDTKTPQQIFEELQRLRQQQTQGTPQSAPQ